MANDLRERVAALLRLAAAAHRVYPPPIGAGDLKTPEMSGLTHTLHMLVESYNDLPALLRELVTALDAAEKLIDEHTAAAWKLMEQTNAVRQERDAARATVAKQQAEMERLAKQAETLRAFLLLKDDPEFHRQLAEGKKAREEGKLIPLSQLKAELAADAARKEQA